MDFQTIGAAVNGLKTATDIVRAIVSLNKDAEINAKVIELQNVILSLQSHLLQIQEDLVQMSKAKDKLEKELAGAMAWTGIEKEYKLTEVAQGVFVYSSQLDPKPNAPAHWLCPNCFEKRQKSILQMIARRVFFGPGAYGSLYECPNCKMEIRAVS